MSTLAVEKSVGYEIGAGVRRAGQVRPYERRLDDPLYRPLHIYTLDPATSRRVGAVHTLKVPYERLEPGPKGAVFEVDPYDAEHHCSYSPLDLDDPGVLIRSGVAPAPSDHRFHLQMVYAVASDVYDTFRTALGRVPTWGFEGAGGEPARLRLRPFGAAGVRNAWYSPADGEVTFGYYQTEGPVAGRNLPGGLVFTALSHDIIVHEVTHALLDGLRSCFLIPSRPDVLAFHEAFSDLIAYFLHFSYKDVVAAAIRNSRGDLRRAELLTELAKQFGQTTGSPQSLRIAIEDSAAKIPALYDPGLGSHALGGVLVNAVFDAFVTVYEHKTRRYWRLATGGSGELRPGDLPHDLLEILAEEASNVASQFLRMIIRAIDYCPPADLSFGEFLRAVVTADHDLVPDDPWKYREAWVDAFVRRRIYPRGVGTLSEKSLLWQPPPRDCEIRELSFDRLELSGDPARPARPEELVRQARALGEFVAQRDMLEQFGLIEPGEHAGLPKVQSVRTLRRIGPDGQVIFDLVAEVTQRQIVADDAGEWEVYGGSTVIIGPDGKVRYVILTRAESEDRRGAQRQYITGDGARYWEKSGGRLRPKPELFRHLHVRDSCG